MSKWETGRAEPSLDSLAKIHHLFASSGYTLEQLILGSHGPAPLPADDPPEKRSGEGRPAYAVPQLRPESADEVAVLVRFRELRPQQRKGLLALISG